MKKVITAMILLLLFACGCTATGSAEQSQPVSGSRDYDSVAEYAPQLRTFYEAVCRQGQAAPVTLPGEIQLAFDGENYLFSDTSGSRTYRYFLCRPSEQEDAVWEYLMLSDDPDMTAEKCKSAGDGVILLRQALDVSPLEKIGQAPAVISQLLQSRNNAWVFAQKSYFQLVADDPTSLGSTYTLNRFDYEGVLMSSTELPYYPNSEYVWETPEGGFLLKYESFEQKDYSLRCYDARGQECWSYQFPEGIRYHGTVNLLQKDGKIYLFGYKMTQASEQGVYMCIFSRDGALLKENALETGVSLSYVQQQKDGFLLYGTTDRTDGSFGYYSGEGPAAPFKAVFDSELSLQSAQVAEERFVAKQIGYFEGQPAYRFTVSRLDGVPMPAQLSQAWGVFDYAGGYVIYEDLNHGTPVYLQDPLQSTQKHYYQRVYTGYDAQGTLLWRSVSDVYSK